MKAPAMAKRLIGQIPTTSGTLTDKGGRSVPVMFSLAQWRFYVGEVPSMRSAEGKLEFLNLADAFDMRDVQQGVTLEGGGVRAQVSMLSLRTFSVIGGYISNGSVPRRDAAEPHPEILRQ